MLRKLLVALDSSKRDATVFETALNLAKALDAPLLLVHVLSFHEPGSPVLPSQMAAEYSPGIYQEAMDAYRHQWQEFEQQQTDHLKVWCDRAIAQGVSADIMTSYGAPGQSICMAAQSWGAELIIMGSRGRAGLSELLLGSVSSYVSHHAPCSVMIVHPQMSEAIASEPDAPSELPSIL